jgi:endonuclease G
MNAVADPRLEIVSQQLDGSPKLREAVQKALIDGRFGDMFDAELTDSAKDKLALDAGALETVMPAAAVEAIVRKVGRPPLIVRNDQVVMELLPDFPDGTGKQIKKIQGVVTSVGRVEFANYDMSWGGTGWVVDAKGDTRLCITNRHVAKLVAQRAADGSGLFLRNPWTGIKYKMSIDFNEEVDATAAQARSFAVTEVVYLADDTAADVAIIRIRAEAGAVLPDPLVLAGKEAEVHDLVALIGYPAYDPRNDAGDQARYFKDLYEVKRFAPGKVMQAVASDTPLSHDCTSLGGNSGSPLIRIDDGSVVGLHFAGEYGKSNSAIGVLTLKKLVAGERPISVAIEKAEADAEAVADGVHAASHFLGRTGYDPAFLSHSLKAPWPGVGAAVEADLASPSDATAANQHELRYTHFGVLFSKGRRQPVITAVNIDGSHSVHVKRANDKWFKDERISKNIQLDKSDYDDELIDRGHMVRREDPNWDPTWNPGASPDAAPTALVLQANDDTFHYTNASPQHSRLNQGKQLWQGLENFILDNARTRGFRACVFTGPVVSPEDPEIKKNVVAPLEYWKVVVMVDADKDALHATAYLLSQGQLIRKLLEDRSKIEAVEGFVLGEYRTFQIAIQDLADATGYDFSAYVPFDPLTKTAGGQEAVASGLPAFVPLAGLESIVT